MDAASFPAKARSAHISVGGRDTHITTIAFADRLLFTISQTGTVAHWVHVPLNAGSDAQMGQALDSSDTDIALLPSAHLTATTVLGGTRQDDETFGQMLATTIASSVLLKRPEDARLLVLGIGLQGSAHLDKAQFDELLDALLPFI